MQVTYSSDYFQELYDLAVKLIKSGNAFVCHQTAEEISEYRFGSFSADAESPKNLKYLLFTSCHSLNSNKANTQKVSCNMQVEPCRVTISDCSRISNAVPLASAP